MRKLLHGSGITGRERNVLAAFEMENLGGVLVNKAGVGTGASNGTITAARQAFDKVLGKVMRFDGSTSICTYTVTGVNTQLAGTISLWVRPLDALVGDRFFHQGAVISYYSVQAFNNALYTRIGNAASQAGNHTFLQNRWVRLLVTWTSTHVYVYVNGVLTDDYDTTFTDNLVLGRIGAGGAGPVFVPYCDIADLLVQTRTYTAAEAAADYSRYATRTLWQEDFGNVNVSPIAEGGTVGAHLSNSQFRFGDAVGRFQIVDDMIKGRAVKVVACTTAGQLYVPAQYLGSEAASPEMGYGTWEWYWKKTAASASNVGFISSTADITTMNGYWLQLDNAEYVYLRRIAGGALVLTLMVAGVGTFPVDTWAKVTIARRYDGRFSVYKDGVLLVAAVGANPSTDTGYTSGSYVVFNMGVGDRVALLSKRFGECL